MYLLLVLEKKASSNIMRHLDLANHIETTINVERFAGVNIRGFSPMKFFAEILSRCIGHQCLLLTYR